MSYDVLRNWKILMCFVEDKERCRESFSRLAKWSAQVLSISKCVYQREKDCRIFWVLFILSQFWETDWDLLLTLYNSLASMSVFNVPRSILQVIRSALLVCIRLFFANLCWCLLTLFCTVSRYIKSDKIVIILFNFRMPVPF